MHLGLDCKHLEVQVGPQLIELCILGTWHMVHNMVDNIHEGMNN